MTKPPRLDLTPSSAERWTTCTASPHFILENADKLPASTDTPYNIEGKAAHEVAAAYLLEQKLPHSDPDMLWHGWNYAEYVTGLRAKQSLLFVESKMELWYMPGRNAIVDAAIINPLSMHVVDYKYGEGIVVHPEGNLQAVIYAYSAGKGHNLADDHPVFIHIYQPRGRASETGPAHVWETTWATIKLIARRISETAVLIQGADATQKKYLEFAPSDKACQWCPAKGFCAARQASLLSDIEALAVIENEPPALPMPNVLSDEQVAAVLTHSGQIGKWLGEVEAYALERMRAGTKLPGFKLVMSRGGNRYWSDEKKATDLLLKDTILKRSEIVEESIKGPAAIETLIGKKKFSTELTNLIARAPGVPVIAPEGDKREAIGGALDDIEVLT